MTDPRLDFWAERVLSEIAGLDDEAMYEKLGREMRDAQAARDAGRGPCQSDYNRIGRRLMEVHERVQNNRRSAA